MGEISVPFSVPEIGEEEIEAARRVLERRWLTMGEETEAFEAEAARALDVRHAVAVSSCTAALHLALRALEVGAGDEVVVPSLTFVATANAVLYCGATPVFADVAGIDDPNVSAETIAAAIGPRTKGFVSVHYAGHPAPLGALGRLAQERGLFHVEDAAQAIGAARDGRGAGAAGDAGCFSFYSTKNATTAEGGLVTTDRDDLAARVRLLRSHGMTASVLERDRGDRFGYDIVDLGFNYRMDEIRAAIGRVQLTRVARGNARRADLAASYRNRLAVIPGVEVPFAGVDGVSSHHLQPIVLPEGVDRDALAGALRAEGVQTSVHYRPVHLTALYRERLGTGEGLVPVTEAFARRELTLPLFSGMTDAQLETVASALEATLARSGG